MLVQRARMATLARLGQRSGYALFGVALGVFVFGIATSFSVAVAVIVVVSLAGGSVLLAPAIVLGYAVKAAEREDRERAVRTTSEAPSARHDDDAPG
ncbi:MAG: hypothetical protein ACYDH6_16465 [Acidimicrobiales bacterium]